MSEDEISGSAHAMQRPDGPMQVSGLQTSDLQASNGAPRTGLLAAGGIAGAIGATSCCILPLGLSVMGVGGAWIANLRALAPYQPLFVLVAVGFIGAGFFFTSRLANESCADGQACARPLPNALVKSTLWVSALIVLGAITFNYWFIYLLPYLP